MLSNTSSNLSSCKFSNRRPTSGVFFDGAVRLGATGGGGAKVGHGGGGWLGAGPEGEDDEEPSTKGNNQLC